eukprot:5633089-Karenia_brevis.AAC.1
MGWNCSGVVEVGVGPAKGAVSAIWPPCPGPSVAGGVLALQALPPPPPLPLFLPLPEDFSFLPHISFASLIMMISQYASRVPPCHT